MIDKNTKFFINGTGRFEQGGPIADTGLTGRKIIVDTYGGVGSHGGGCFSGKDPSKVDRSGSYMARYVAKNVVAAGLADRVEIQVAYAIGIAEPVSLMIDTFGTAKVSEDKIKELIRAHFPLTPKGMIKHLDLKRPIYRKTAAFGHFGRTEPEFTWERTDLAADPQARGRPVRPAAATPRRLKERSHGIRRQGPEAGRQRPAADGVVGPLHARSAVHQDPASPRRSRSRASASPPASTSPPRPAT